MAMISWTRVCFLIIYIIVTEHFVTTRGGPKPKDGVHRLGTGSAYVTEKVTWDSPWYFELDASPVSHVASPVSFAFEFVLHRNASKKCSDEDGIHVILRKRCKERDEDNCDLPSAEQEVMMMKLSSGKRSDGKEDEALHESPPARKRMGDWNPIILRPEGFLSVYEREMAVHSVNTSNLGTSNLLSEVPEGLRLVKFVKSRYLPAQSHRISEYQSPFECGCSAKDPFGGRGWPDRESAHSQWLGSVMVVSQNVECDVHIRVSAFEACSGHGKWAPRADDPSIYECMCDPHFSGSIGEIEDENLEEGRVPPLSSYGCSESIGTNPKRVVTADIPAEKSRDPIGCFETDVRDLANPSTEMDRDQQIGCTGRLLRERKKKKAGPDTKARERNSTKTSSSSKSIYDDIEPQVRLKNLLYRHNGLRGQ
eukprot:g1401.t1